MFAIYYNNTKPSPLHSLQSAFCETGITDNTPRIYMLFDTFDSADREARECNAYSEARGWSSRYYVVPAPMHFEPMA